MGQAEQSPPGLVVREPHGNLELRALEDLQIDVWGFDAREAVPAAHFRAVQHVGGMVLGAYVDERLVGFAYGFPALAHDAWEEGVGIHSHMVGVGRGRQGVGVGRALKWAQRSWCLEKGITWMSWTFDPIQARNARLNFHYLGARSHEYLVDFYGIMPGSLHGNLTSDRLLVFWDLRSRDVTTPWGWRPNRRRFPLRRGPCSGVRTASRSRWRRPATPEPYGSRYRKMPTGSCGTTRRPPRAGAWPCERRWRRPSRTGSW
jgi:predicted GNAT superfamily acetyltransferase